MAQSTKQPHFHLIKSSEMEIGEKTVRDPPSAAAGGGSGAAAAAAKSLDCTFIHPTRTATGPAHSLLQIVKCYQHQRLFSHSPKERILSRHGRCDLQHTREEEPGDVRKPPALGKPTQKSTQRQSILLSLHPSSSIPPCVTQQARQQHKILPCVDLLSSLATQPIEI